MNTKFTPGPWTLDIDLRDATGNGVASGDWDGGINCSEWDGYLIAAAPELYEALIYARRFLNDRDHDTDFVDSVLRKAATGKCQC